MAIFKRAEKRSKGLETAYDRRRSFMMSRLMCFAVAGVLVYYTIKAAFEEGETPLWFIIAMAALIAGTIIIIVWNVRAVKELDRKAAADEAVRQNDIEHTITVDQKEDNPDKI
jgi:Na+/melibiose symporter-like transporter